MLPYNATDITRAMRTEYGWCPAEETAEQKRQPSRTRRLERLVHLVGAALTGAR